MSGFASAHRATDSTLCDRQRLEAALHDLWKRGREAWPGITLDPLAFAAYLGEQAPASAEVGAWLDGLRAGDIFLACACALGIPQAIHTFAAAFLDRMKLYLRTLRPTPDLVAETRQELLIGLFVGAPGRSAKIRQYRGRGTLDRWVSVAAVRTALDILRRQRKHRSPDDEDVDERHDDELRGAAIQDRDPELDLVRASCQDDFDAAFRAVMSSLPPRARALLRLTYLDGLTPARIGMVYGVHRTTAMHWVDATHEEVLARTRSRLMERLSLSQSECDGIFALVADRTEWTLAALLHADGEAVPPEMRGSR